MRLYVPTIGAKLRLTAPWEFPLFAEYRNKSAIDFLQANKGIDTSWDALHGYGRQMQSVPTTLPEGSILQVDRIYIRKGKGAWDSITFKLLRHPDMKNKKGNYVACKCRFWAKLEDCNYIECEREES